ncbi:PglL family O-oligosaccharyltransferase [Serratia rubidaea]|uniref:PglL family O-oligosaccharyltransferase n=1 Tax=Serratia rubidaea TaxID=61652 RepID=UPI00300E41C6
MQRPRSVWNTNNALAACFLGLLAASLCYLPNMGGSGLKLPLNALTYALMATMLLLICWRQPDRRTWRLSRSAAYFLPGVALLSVPLAYAPPDGYATAAWRVSALLAGWLWYCGWLQVRLAFRWRTALIALLLALTAGQSLIALLQLFWPGWSWVPLRGTRVFGIFQQPNVLGSFIATGLALALMLAVLPGYVLRAARAERARQAGLAALLALLAALLVWVQSRAGWLGGALVLAGFWLAFRRVCAPRLQRAALAVLLGGAFATALLLWLGETGEVRYVSHALSNQARLAMLQDTLKMIAVKPWLGWGYGQFEYAFQHFRIAQQSPTPVLEIAGHPHNEILLWWLEGGLVALAGIVLLLLGGVHLLRQALRVDRRAFSCRRRHAGEATALCLALLPMLLHSQLEYPFYLSALHWLLFMLLLAQLDRLSSRRSVLTLRRSRPLRLGVTLLCVSGLVLMLAALRAGWLLTQAERGGLRDVRPLREMSSVVALSQQPRREFDLQTQRLLAYNQTRDEQQLTQYRDWARRYLRVRIDANVYASLIAILRYQQHSAEAERYRADAALLFPADARFSGPRQATPN